MCLLTLERWMASFSMVGGLPFNVCQTKRREGVTNSQFKLQRRYSVANGLFFHSTSLQARAHTRSQLRYEKRFGCIGCDASIKACSRDGLTVVQDAVGRAWLHCGTPQLIGKRLIVHKNTTTTPSASTLHLSVTAG